MLSPAETAARVRGRDYKRVMRAAAAVHGLYDDVAIAKELGVSRNTVGAWWKGALPEPDTLRRFADATDLSVEELWRFVYSDGPAPLIDWTTAGVLGGDQRGRTRQGGEAPNTPVPPPGRPPRGNGRAHG